jgi:cell division protein FtsL
VNKLLVTEKEVYINGSNALEVEREYEKQKSKKQEQQEDREKQKKLRELNNKRRKEVAKCIACVFVVGMVVISRYSYIYKNEMNIRNVKSSILELKNENDALKVEISKYQDINKIDEIAREELKMVSPSKVDVLYCDFGDKYFKNSEEKKADNKGEILSKIKDILF